MTVGFLAPNGISITQFLYIRLREHHEEGRKDLPEDHSDNCRVGSSGQDKNVATMNSQQCGCLHKICKDIIS